MQHVKSYREPQHGPLLSGKNAIDVIFIYCKSLNIFFFCISSLFTINIEVFKCWTVKYQPHDHSQSKPFRILWKLLKCDNTNITNTVAILNLLHMGTTVSKCCGMYLFGGWTYSAFMALGCGKTRWWVFILGLFCPHLLDSAHCSVMLCKKNKLMQTTVDFLRDKVTKQPLADTVK